MKILHISTGFPLSFQGGITNYVRQLAEIQYNKGYDVYVLGDTDTHNYPFHYINLKPNSMKAFTLGKIVNHKGLNQLQQIIDVEHFDIIHIHMMLNLDWNIYKILKNKNYVISLHDYYYICPRIKMFINDQVCIKYDKHRCENCISMLDTYNLLRKSREYVNIKFKKDIRYPRMKQKITDIRFGKFKELLENASILLPVSNRVKQIYETSNFRNNYRVVHIGNISADKYKKYIPTMNNRQKINIAAIGTLTKEKGGDILLKILSQVKNENVEFHFYGGADTYYLPKCEKYGMIYHGRYNQNELEKLLTDVDLGMVLSVWEDNGPQVVMELLNYNVPVLGTKMGGIPDFVNFDNGYIFNPYSDNEINEMINYLNKLSWSEIERMKMNIHRTTNFNEHFQELDSIYNTILMNE